MDQRLLQAEAARQIGVRPATLKTWEWNQARPRAEHMPQVIAFLGYCPYRTYPDFRRLA